VTSPKTVLVPLDGSVAAAAAIPVARGFAELVHGTVAILHVSDDALAPAALIERTSSRTRVAWWPSAGEDRLRR
jgi:nucleotide-binding universal stress UspA family protein